METEDRNLYLKLKNGDEQAFRALFLKYYPSLCLFADQILNDKVLAEEVVQEMFVKIWEKHGRLEIELSVKHYFFRSVRNQCLNYIQHEKIKKQYVNKMLIDSQQEIDTDSYFIEIGLMERISKCIDSLPPKRQEIFRLSREQGLKYKEIAETLNISIKTVEAQMGLALKYLREELKDYDNQITSLLFILRKNVPTN